MLIEKAEENFIRKTLFCPFSVFEKRKKNPFRKQQQTMMKNNVNQFIGDVKLIII
jgi:hypothetical protein